MNSIKNQNKETDEQNTNNSDKSKSNNFENIKNINNDLLNKLKKVNLQLLLSIYQRKQNLLIKNIFDKWKTNTNININKLKKRNKALIKQISKYIKKTIGGCFKKKSKEKTFAKKKTKLNLYKERFN